ncbi:hypothetical protein ACQCT3_00820 [Sutcliffiella horikoshii]|uniref:hypothetical protein n=1 Tax=Sutcliffiella horikoshii TaxID=79883 RepID=UPI003CF491B7
MIGKVIEWKMTPEELEAYRKKYPPKPDQKKLKKKAEAFSNIHTYGSRSKKK